MTGDFLLPNGLKTIYHIKDGSPVLCLQLYIRMGSAKESADESGYSHFLEHLVFKSTKDFSESQISKYISGFGGSINAFTDFDCTCYYILIPSPYLSQGIHVLSELAVNSTFTSTDVHTEKSIIIEEKHQDLYDPEMEFIEFVQKNSFINNPLRNPVLGASKTIRSITLDKIMSFRYRHYSPKNSFLVVTGDTSQDTILEAVNKYFGSWSSELIEQIELCIQDPVFERPKRTIFKRKRQQTILAFTLPELSEAHPDSHAVYIALRYLAYGNTSRLHNRLVESQQLCSSVKVTSISGIKHGVSAICLYPLSPCYIDTIRVIVMEEILKVLDGKVDPEEFMTIKKDIIYNWLFDLDSTEELANMLGAEELLGNYDNFYQYDSRINSLDFADFCSVVRKYWRQDSIIQFIQTPDFAKTSLSDIHISESKHIPVVRKIHSLVESSGRCKTSYSLIGSNLYEAVLANGMRILYKSIPGKSTCGFALSTALSRLTEPDELAGVNYFTSSATLYSTNRYSHHELQSICRNHGINIGLEHHIDSTIWTGKCVGSELGTASDLLQDIVFNPALSKHNIRTLKLSSIDSMRRDSLNPSFRAYQRWFRLLVGKMRMYDNVAGSITDMRKISLSDISCWHRERYHPCNFTFSVVGSENPDKVFTTLFNVFTDRISNNASIKSSSKNVSPLKATRQYFNSGLDQAIIHIGGHATPAKDREHTTAFYVLAHILGGDLDSRMFCVLREQRGLTYQTGFDYTSTHEFGYWNAYAYCDTKDSDQCINAIMEILDDVRVNGVSDEELSEAKNYMLGMYQFEQENVITHSAFLANLDSLGYEPTYYQDRAQRIINVNKDTIREIARKWFEPNNYYIQTYT